MATLPVSEMSHPATMEDTCPWCGQPIPHEKFIEIKARIRANERARTRDLERRLRDEQDAVLAQVVQVSAAGQDDVRGAEEAARQAVARPLHELVDGHDHVVVASLSFSV